MLDMINEMEKNKLEELSNMKRNEIAERMRSHIDMIDNGKPLKSSLLEIEELASDFSIELNSIECYTQFTRHLSGIFGIDFEFLTDSVKCYSVHCDSHLEYDDEGGAYNEYSISVNSGITVHLNNDEVLNIFNEDINYIINKFIPEYVFKSFKSNAELVNNLTDEDLNEIREKFNVMHDESQSNPEYSSLYSLHGSGNILGVVTRYMDLKKSSAAHQSAGSRLRPVAWDNETPLEERLFIYIRHIESMYKDLIYKLHSFECEFDIVKYIEMNSLIGDKLPLMRTLLKELIGEVLYSKLKFMDREFYMKVDLKSKGLSSYTMRHDSYTSGLKDVYSNNELIPHSYIIVQLLYDTINDNDKYIGNSNILKFSRDGSNR